jgi:hypothetical protein
VNGSPTCNSGICVANCDPQSGYLACGSTQNAGCTTNGANNATCGACTTSCNPAADGGLETDCEPVDGGHACLRRCSTALPAFLS